MSFAVSNHQRPGFAPSFQAYIQGKVQHRLGDGPLELLPEGQAVQVDMAIASMVLSWVSEGHPITIALARDEFLHYVDTGSIAILQ